MITLKQCIEHSFAISKIINNKMTFAAGANAEIGGLVITEKEVNKIVSLRKQYSNFDSIFTIHERVQK